MNRRAFLAYAALTGFAVATTKRLPTLAQEATPTPNVFRFDFEDRLVAASRNFEATDLRMTGGVRYSTAVDLFEDAEAAEQAFDRFEDFRTDYFRTLGETTGATINSTSQMSAPPLGDRNKAEAIALTIENLKLEFVLFFAQRGAVLHRWFGAGLTSPADEFFAIARDHMKFDVIDPTSDEEVFALIPSLDDLPEGFVLVEGSGELIERFGSFAASPTPGTPEPAD